MRQAGHEGRVLSWLNYTPCLATRWRGAHLSQNTISCSIKHSPNAIVFVSVGTSDFPIPLNRLGSISTSICLGLLVASEEGIISRQNSHESNPPLATNWGRVLCSGRDGADEERARARIVGNEWKLLILFLRRPSAMSTFSLFVCFRRLAIFLLSLLAHKCRNWLLSLSISMYAPNVIMYHRQAIFSKSFSLSALTHLYTI